MDRRAYGLVLNGVWGQETKYNHWMSASHFQTPEGYIRINDKVIWGSNEDAWPFSQVLGISHGICFTATISWAQELEGLIGLFHNGLLLEFQRHWVEFSSRGGEVLSSVCGKQCGDHQCPFLGAVLHVWLVRRVIEAKQSHASSPHPLAPDLSSTSRLSSVTLHPQVSLLGAVWFLSHWL